MRKSLHKLKTETEYYQAIVAGDKTFELRKNDRDYRKCDGIELLEVVNGVPTGCRHYMGEIQYLFTETEYGLKDGYCIFCCKY